MHHNNNPIAFCLSRLNLAYHHRHLSLVIPHNLSVEHLLQQLQRMGVVTSYRINHPQHQTGKYLTHSSPMELCAPAANCGKKLRKTIYIILRYSHQQPAIGQITCYWVHRHKLFMGVSQLLRLGRTNSLLL